LYAERQTTVSALSIKLERALHVGEVFFFASLASKVSLKEAWKHEGKQTSRVHGEKGS
jgi:hypothetical protein